MLDNTPSTLLDDEHVTMTLLNGTGDTTIAWTKESDAEIRTYIDEKLAQGYSFFALENPSLLGRMFGRKPSLFALQDVNQLKDREIRLDDNQAEALFRQGKVSVVRGSREDIGSSEPVATAGRLRTVDAIVSTRSIAVRPMAGG